MGGAGILPANETPTETQLRRKLAKRFAQLNYEEDAG
jgi:hypothetical protein